MRIPTWPIRVTVAGLMLFGASNANAYGCPAYPYADIAMTKAQIAQAGVSLKRHVDRIEPVSDVDAALISGLQSMAQFHHDFDKYNARAKPAYHPLQVDREYRRVAKDFAQIETYSDARQISLALTKLLASFGYLQDEIADYLAADKARATPVQRGDANRRMQLDVQSVRESLVQHLYCTIEQIPS